MVAVNKHAGPERTWFPIFCYRPLMQLVLSYI